MYEKLYWVTKIGKKTKTFKRCRIAMLACPEQTWTLYTKKHFENRFAQWWQLQRLRQHDLVIRKLRLIAINL
jgi:hypothetical protein